MDPHLQPVQEELEQHQVLMEHQQQELVEAVVELMDLHLKQEELVELVEVEPEEKDVDLVIQQEQPILVVELAVVELVVQQVYLAVQV